SISDGRLSYQFSSDGYIRRSVYAYGSFHHLKNDSLKYLTCNTEKTQNHTLNKNLIIKQICMDKLQDEI
ncbi:hypothetical protein, partial [Escherichia coli]|uniref:hypothetical protein n=1 Tax=Escherichia coli TaxID=562 RepID=UPI0011EA3581